MPRNKYERSRYTAVEVKKDHIEYFKRYYDVATSTKAISMALDELIEIDPDAIRKIKTDRSQHLALPELVKYKLCQATGNEHWMVAAMEVLCDFLTDYDIRSKQEEEARHATQT